MTPDSIARDTDMTAQVWIIGGYGDVGRKLAGMLAQDCRLSVVIAGRDGSKADAAAAAIGPQIRGVGLDVTHADAEKLPPAAYVNLVEATPPDLVAALVSRGARMIESSATPTYLKALEYAVKERPGPGLLALNAGVSPGLTNVMAAALKRRFPDTRSADIVIEIGMGRHHGNAATRWTFASMGADYPAWHEGNETRVRPGALSRKVRFEGDRSARLALGFGFSDQIAIGRQLNLDGAWTFLAVDPPWVTRAIQATLRAGLGAVLAGQAGRLTDLFARGPTMGRSGTRLLVEGHDDAGSVSGRIEIHTGSQAAATAAMLALAVRSVLEIDASGIGQFNDLVTLGDAVAALKTAAPETRVFGRGD